MLLVDILLLLLIAHLSTFFRGRFLCLCLRLFRLLFLRLYCFVFLFLVRLLLFPFVCLFVLVVVWDLRLENKNGKQHHLNDPNAVLYK
jgi:hypothetical protein